MGLDRCFEEFWYLYLWGCFRGLWLFLGVWFSKWVIFVGWCDIFFIGFYEIGALEWR